MSIRENLGLGRLIEIDWTSSIASEWLVKESIAMEKAE
jgi:hypothetical protein